MNKQFDEIKKDIVDLHKLHEENMKKSFPTGLTTISHDKAWDCDYNDAGIEETVSRLEQKVDEIISYLNRK